MHRGLRWGNLRERERLEDLGVDGRIILKCVQEVGWGMDVIYLTSGYKQVADCFDYGKEPSGSTK